MCKENTLTFNNEIEEFEKYLQNENNRLKVLEKLIITLENQEKKDSENTNSQENTPTSIKINKLNSHYKHFSTPENDYLEREF